MMMTKLFVMLSLMPKYNKADWVLTDQKNGGVFIHSEDKKVNHTPGSYSNLCYFVQRHRQATRDKYRCFTH